MPKIVTKQASENPILFYKHFLERHRADPTRICSPI